MSEINTESETMDKIYWPQDLMNIFHKTRKTIHVWEKTGKLPPPDVHISGRTKGWKATSLRNHGIPL